MQSKLTCLCSTRFVGEAWKKARTKKRDLPCCCRFRKHLWLGQRWSNMVVMHSAANGSAVMPLCHMMATWQGPQPSLLPAQHRHSQHLHDLITSLHGNYGVFFQIIIIYVITCYYLPLLCGWCDCRVPGQWLQPKTKTSSVRASFLPFTRARREPKDQ